MKTFACPGCQQVVFFENDRCERCGTAFGYCAETHLMLPPTPERPLCAHALTTHDGMRACNWLTPSDGTHTLCVSCQHTVVIPDLGVDENRRRWMKIEAAKRRLFHTLLTWGLPIDDAHLPGALTFAFMADVDGAPAVMTGHLNGRITLNIAEADDAVREAVRTQMGEPYRTLTGHLRHEIGHHQWDRLVAHGPNLDGFRALFGDERQDYAQSLAQHHLQGPQAGWPQRFVSAYAAAHPWEDWAETWAHWMHIVDALDTAAHWGLALAQGSGSAMGGAHDAAPTPPLALSDELPGGLPRDPAAFRRALTHAWLPLSQFLNSMGRSLGHGDAYPFVLSDPVLDKLCFVHGVATQAAMLCGPTACPIASTSR